MIMVSKRIKVWSEVTFFGLWAAMCLVACASPDALRDPGRPVAQNGLSAKSPLTGTKRVAADPEPAGDTVTPVCPQAQRFLHQDYSLLARRYGAIPFPFPESLRGLIFQATPQMWERIEFHHIEYSHGRRSVHFGGINIVMPPGWNIGLHRRSNSWAVCEVDTLPGELPHNPFPITFHMSIELPARALPRQKAKAGARRAAALHSRLKPRRSPPAEPDLVRAIDSANTTPMDFFALLGSRTATPQRWQVELFERIFRRLAIKESGLGSAVDCLFNGHVYAIIGVSPRHKGELANISLFGPYGTFRGRIYIHYWYLKGPLAYSRALKRCENLVRGISLLRPRRATEEQKEVATKIKPSEIPLLLAADIALRRDMESATELEKLEQLRLGNRLIRLNKRMGSNGVPLWSVVRTWFLDSSGPGGVAGYHSLAAGRAAFARQLYSGGSYLFITSPIKSFGDRVLVVRSKPGDYETTLLSVDRSLKVSLLYDSLEIPQPVSLKHPDVGMGPIYRIRVAKPGTFYLYETAEKGISLKNIGAIATHPRPRVFVIDFPNGHFRIRPARSK